jgi:hypothetical protein
LYNSKTLNFNRKTWTAIKVWIWDGLGY